VRKSSKELKLKHMTTCEVDSVLTSQAPLFLPMGTLEAHGRHLPSGTDTICAEEVALALARTFGGVVAPPIEYGLTNVFAQTAPASFSPVSVFSDYVENVIVGFLKHGFTKIVIINGHGGNREPLKPLIRKMSRRGRAALAVINWWILATDVSKKIYGEASDGHAALEETSCVLAKYPELVKKEFFEKEKDLYIPDDGIWLFPPPGEVLISEPEKGLPDFSQDKAEKFFDAVIDDIKGRLSVWFDSLGKFQNKRGLR